MTRRSFISYVIHAEFCDAKTRRRILLDHVRERISEWTKRRCLAAQLNRP